MKNNLENQDIKTDKPLALSYAELKASHDAQLAENARMKEIIDAVTDLDNEPEYHDCGMGCGLEDRGITDRG